MENIKDVQTPQKKPNKFWNSIKKYFSNPANIIIITSFIILGFFNLRPLISLLISTFKITTPPEILFLPDKDIGDLTLFWWKRVIASDMSKTIFFDPLLNSLEMSIIASLIAILYGGVVAFLITRTDIKGKKFLSSVFVFPYMMPSWTIATFWQNFFQNPAIGTGRGGMLYNLLHIAVPESMVYGIVPCGVVLGLHYAPFAYILIGGILRNMDANLEEAAVILKTNRARIIARITLPIVMPAILSTFLLVFASSMSAYAVPQYLSGGKFVLTTFMKQYFRNGYNGQAYIFSVVMIIFGVAILLANQSLTGKRKSFTTVSGKSGQVSYIKMKFWNIPISVLLIILSAFTSILPLITFALESLCVKAGDYSTLTLQYWLAKETVDAGNGLKGLLFERQVWNAFGNSILLAFLCALIAGTLGMFIGYAVARKRGTWLAKTVDSLAFLPYLMPSMALGAAFLAVGSEWGLSKSFLILIIVGSIKYLPFASRSGINAMLQLSPEIEEAATIVDVKWPKRMARIIFPIQKSTFISGYLLPFTSCMRELSLFVLLVAPKTTLLTTLLDDWMAWWPQSANALNLLIILTVLLINFLVNKLTGASIDKGVGG